MKLKKYFSIFLIFMGILALIALVFLGSVFLWARFSPSDETHLSGREQYNGEELADFVLFPQEIPQSAAVVGYSNYKYYHTEQDIYLELRFTDQASMEAYMSEMQEKLAGEETKTLQNPFDTAYTDIFVFSSLYVSNGRGERFFYFENHPFETNHTSIQAHYACISYSYETLTVVTTYFSVGEPAEKGSMLIPDYAIKFDIDLDLPIQYTVNFDGGFEQ